jgi:hypothetical protein
VIVEPVLAQQLDRPDANDGLNVLSVDRTNEEEEEEPTFLEGEAMGDHVGDIADLLPAKESCDSNANAANIVSPRDLSIASVNLRSAIWDGPPSEPPPEGSRFVEGPDAIGSDVELIYPASDSESSAPWIFDCITIPPAPFASLADDSPPRPLRSQSFDQCEELPGRFIGSADLVPGFQFNLAGSSGTDSQCGSRQGESLERIDSSQSVVPEGARFIDGRDVLDPKDGMLCPCLDHPE